MSIMLTKIISGLIMSISVFIIVKNLVNSNIRYFNVRNIITIILVSLPICLFYNPEYNGISTILTFLISIIVFKITFSIRLSTSILAMSSAMLLTALVDYLVLPFTILMGYENARDTWYIILLNNILIFIVAIILTKIKGIKIQFQKFCLKIDSNGIVPVIFFSVISFWILIISFLNLSKHINVISNYILTAIVVVLVAVLYYLYVKECNNYNSLNQEYNAIFKYIQTFEDWIDNEQMYRHELKNNLSIIRSMTKNKKIINKIDEMLKFSIILDESDIECLKDIPKGGLKGLLYYKLAISKTNKIKLTIEVSPKVTKTIKKLKDKDLKQTCIILGIYLDNAMEASMKTKKKNVTLEIYESNNSLIFVISNTYKDLIPIKKMYTDGYTTKGAGRGRGLYYVNKVLSKSKNMHSKRTFLDDYFIQKLYIKKEL